MGGMELLRSNALLTFAAFVADSFLTGTAVLQERLWIGLLFSLLISAISFRLQFLNFNGGAVSFLLGTIIFGIGGWSFSLPILCFFILSSGLSKISESRCRDISSLFQKSSRRDAGQVLANGGIAAALVLVWHFTTAPIWYILFLGAVAAVTADTWATEIGILISHRPRSVVAWQPVPAGTSGGITLAGVAGAVSGALMITVIGGSVRLSEPAYQFGRFGIIFITLGGVLAHLLDSFLGATI